MTLKDIFKAVEGYNTISEALGEKPKAVSLVYWLSAACHYEPITAATYGEMVKALKVEYVTELVNAIKAYDGFTLNQPAEIRHGWKNASGEETATVEIVVK